MKLLPKPAVALAYGEPWRGRRGAIVCDQPGVAGPRVHELGNRAYYGGTLIAESVDGRLAQRAADCVNFCAGIEFQEDHAYVGGLADLLDALEVLHSRMPEPVVPVGGRHEREYYRLYSDVDAILRQFNRDSSSRALRGAS